MLKRELKINLKSLILWTVIIVATYIAVFSIYPELMNDENSQMMNQMMKALPEDMLSIFNMDIVEIDTAYGWYKTEGYIYITLLGGIYAATLGATILIKEESDKTIEFLYSKPISRNKIVTSKILCGIINLSIFTTVITIVNYIGLKAVQEIDIKEYLMIAIIPILLFFMFFFTCLLISTFMKKTKKAMGVGIAFVFVHYVIQTIGGMSESVKILKDISFFEFVSSRDIILNNEINIKYLFIGLAISVVCGLLTYVRYNKKELV